jgi:alginate O-acetyltransferase complex protein AlgI
LSFASLQFVLFLGLYVALALITKRFSAQKWLLIFFSYCFYLTWGLSGIFIITVLAVVDFGVGRKLASSTQPGTPLRWLCLGLAANLGALGFFKYATFLSETIAAMVRPLGLHFRVPEHPLLQIIGLSYFTFAGISYLLDVYYERMEPSQSVSEFICYLIYFPKLIAGPIARARDLLPQLRLGICPTLEDLETGCAYFLIGAVKKLVIADQLASHVSMILAAPQHYNALTLVQGLIGYTVQIYTDFSGYSDMAIGCARLMGHKLPQNFLMPYSSVNIAEFWRRWHVTMSTWFRDYVFLPLEIRSRGIRDANIRASRNIIITMLLCGLWHGASWNFVLWGGWHGLALAVYQAYASLGRKVQRGTQSAFHPGTLAARALTLTVVMLGYVLFGTQTLNSAFTYFWRMVTWKSDGVALGSPYILPLTATVVAFHLLVDKDRNLIEELVTYSIPARVVTYTLLLLAMTSLVSWEATPFVYVQF